MTARPPKITERILCVISLAYTKPGYFFRVSCSLFLHFIGWDTTHRMRVPCQEIKMTPFFSFKANVFLLALSFAVISTITYAFASTNTGNFDPAGHGAEMISGYVVTNVTYQLGIDPSKIASTSFTLSAPAVKVLIQLSDAQTNWYNCVNVSGNDWTCDTNNTSLKSANELQVIALGN